MRRRRKLADKRLKPPRSFSSDSVNGMLGGVFGYLDVAILHHSTNEIGAFALVGMGAVFAGIVRAPISYELILPLMISNMTAYALARRVQPTPIYEALLEQDEIQLPRRHGPVTHALEVQVKDAMTTNLVVIPAEETPETALQLIRPRSFSTYPVVDRERGFLGLVTEARIRRSLAEDGNQTIEQLADQTTQPSPEYPLIRAVMRMNEKNIRQLPVVHRLDQTQLVGLLTLTDIVRAQARAAKAAGAVDRTVVPTFAEERETLEG